MRIVNKVLLSFLTFITKLIWMFNIYIDKKESIQLRKRVLFLLKDLSEKYGNFAYKVSKGGKRNVETGYIDNDLNVLMIDKEKYDLVVNDDLDDILRLEITYGFSVIFREPSEWKNEDGSIKNFYKGDEFENFNH